MGFVGGQGSQPGGHARHEQAARSRGSLGRAPAVTHFPRRRWALLAVVWLVAVNLRSGLIAVSPVLPLVRRALGLDHAAAQVIFSLPLVLMFAFAIPGGILADRFGTRRLLIAGLALLGAGEMLRVTAGSYAALLADTLVWGVGLGAVQPALAKIVQDWFPDRSQVATAIYTTGFTSGAALAGWLTAPFLLDLTGSWRGTFAAWGALAGATCLIWLAVGRDAHPPSAASRGRPLWGRPSVLAGSPERARQIAWVAALYAAQSVFFYGMSAWLPTYLYEVGWPIARVGGPYTLFEAVAIPSIVLGPLLMERLGRRRPTMVVTAAFSFVSVVGLALLPHRGAWVFSALAGVTNPLAFVMSLALPIEIAPPGRVGSLMGLVLTVGYAFGLLTPPLAGALRDLTGHPAAGLIPVMVGALGMVVASARVPERRPRGGADARSGAGAPGEA